LFLKILFLFGTLLVVISIATISCAVPVSHEASRTYSLSELQADFRQFQQRIEASSPLYFTDRDELAGLFGSQYALLRDGMNELEFLRILSPIVSFLKCGHSHVYVSPEYQAYLNKVSVYLPFKVKLIENRLYLIDNLSQSDIPVGSEIVSIDGRSAEEILKIMLANLSADGENQTKKHYIINRWFNAVYFYYVDNPTSFEVVYKSDSNATPRLITVDAIADETMHMSTMIPYTEEWDSSFSKEIIDDYAVLTIKLFAMLDTGKYKAFLSDFFLELKERKISNLILDLRDNWGGTPGPAAELLQYLITEPTPLLDRSAHPLLFMYKRPIKPHEYSFKGQLYTLMDGASFSTTGHVLAVLKYHDIGVFVGEESGGGYMCTDGSHRTKLKNTHLTLYCSTKPFKAATPGLTEGRGIMPHYEVAPTLSDYLENSDSIKAKAIELISKVD